MEVLYNENKTHYVVLVSSGYGAGWSTWGDERLAYDKRVVEWYIAHSTQDFCDKVQGRNTPEYLMAVDFFSSIDFDTPYFGGYKPGMIRWVPVGKKWTIDEYDGYESLVYADNIKWRSFT